MTRIGIGLCSLDRDSDGLTIKVRLSNLPQYQLTVSAVPENIIRCAIGDADMEYLLGEQLLGEQPVDGIDPEDMFVIPGRDESQCFSLTASEFKDCMKHGEICRDFFGKVDYQPR